MITSMHYYNYYKSHILKNSDTSVVKQVPFNKSADNSSYKKSVNLSKAYNKNVIDYVNELSSTVNTIKVTGNETVQAFKKVIDDNKEDEEIKDDLIIALEDLTNSLNSIENFSKEISHSTEFNNFSRLIQNIFNINEDVLNNISLTLDDGKFVFDVSAFESKNIQELKFSLRMSEEVIEEINLATKDFMNIPMSKHMEFKSFSYYFNYALGAMDKDSFGVIGSGTILNLEL